MGSQEISHDPYTKGLIYILLPNMYIFMHIEYTIQNISKVYIVKCSFNILSKFSHLEVPSFFVSRVQNRFDNQRGPQTSTQVVCLRTLRRNEFRHSSGLLSMQLLSEELPAFKKGWWVEPQEWAHLVNHKPHSMQSSMNFLETTYPHTSIQMILKCYPEVWDAGSAEARGNDWTSASRQRSRLAILAAHQPEASCCQLRLTARVIIPPNREAFKRLIIVQIRKQYVYFGIPITFREAKWRSYRVTFQAIGSHAGEGSPCKGFGWVTFSSPEEAEVRCCKKSAP